MDPAQNISADQPPIPDEPDLESNKQEGPPQKTPPGAWILFIRHLKMVLDPRRILAGIFMWTILAGFIVLPGSFPEIQEILSKSGKFTKVLHFVQNIPLYVLFSLLFPHFDPQNGCSFSFSNV